MGQWDNSLAAMAEQQRSQENIMLERQAWEHGSFKQTAETSVRGGSAAVGGAQHGVPGPGGIGSRLES
jgi:hypothetical protein